MIVHTVGVENGSKLPVHFVQLGFERCHVVARPRVLGSLHLATGDQLTTLVSTLQQA